MDAFFTGLGFIAGIFSGFFALVIVLALIVLIMNYFEGG